jgi:E3 ubiquitin-protein ligase DOA10
MKNGVFWDVTPCGSCKNRRFGGTQHLKVGVRFEVFTVVAMKNAIFWDVTLCGFCKNQRFGGT